MLNLHMAYVVEVTEDGGEPYIERVRFPTPGWLLCSATLVLSRLATVNGPRKLPVTGAIVRRGPDGVIEIVERRKPGA